MSVATGRPVASIIAALRQRLTEKFNVCADQIEEIESRGNHSQKLHCIGLMVPVNLSLTELQKVAQECLEEYQYDVDFSEVDPNCCIGLFADRDGWIRMLTEIDGAYSHTYLCVGFERLND